MNLYYYSFSNKKFIPLSVRSFSVGKIEMSAFLFLATVAPQVAFAADTWVPDWMKNAWDFVVSPVETTKTFLADKATAAGFAILEAIASVIFGAASIFLTMTAAILDMAIKATISSDLYANLSVINVGWTTVRDFSNMLFIFALLYIAIKTILGMAGSSTKRWVANLIIAAVLINFSLFATKVIIDAGNVLAMGFWEKMEMTPGGNDPSASQHIIQGLKLQSAFDVKDADGKTIPTDAAKRVVIYLGGALTMLVAGYVFLAGAIMMIVRTITLIMLMIFSPFAFLSFGLPVGGGFWSKWLSKLIGNAFVAPAFLAMLYLDVIIINSLDLKGLTGADGAKLGGAFSGNIGSFPVIYNFIFVIMLLLASITVANSVSSGAGSSAGSLAKRFIGVGAGAGLTGVAMGGRQFGGRAGKALSEAEWAKKLAKSDNRFVRLGGNMALASGEKMKKGTWDARNAGANRALGLGGVNAGQGGKKNYGAQGSALSGVFGGYRGTEKEKTLIDTAKARYAGDPEAQRKYLLDRSVDLDNKRNKDIKTELDRGEVTASTKKEIKSEAEKYKKKMEELEEAKKDGSGKSAAEVTALETELLATENDVAENMKKLLARLSGKETAEALGEEQLRMKPVISALQTKDLSALNLKANEFTPETIAAINEGIVQNGTKGAQDFLKNQSKVGGVFSYDAAGSLATLTKNYDTEKERLTRSEINQEQFDAFASKQKAEVGKALGMMGGADNIKELADELLTHETLVSQYNRKLVGELTKKIADSRGADSALSKEFADKAREFNPHMKEAAKKEAPSSIILEEKVGSGPRPK